MSERKKGGFWMNIETIIIGAFFLFFIIWAAQKCNNSPKAKQNEADKTRQAFIRDSINNANAKVVVTPPVTTTTTVTNTPVQVTTPAPTTVNAPAKPTTPTTPNPATPTVKEEQFLYVTIDGLNVRAEPDLKAKSFGKLKLYDKVAFLGKVTQETQELSLGADKANEPWIKIRTKRGTIGWVYGAGVSYYKTKRKGVM
jgi:hypothetical protein